MTMLFFFSSRRRHTRLTCDWSSDVCSSDLGSTRGQGEPDGQGQPRDADPLAEALRGADPPRLRQIRQADPKRSEERRVGKECISWRMTDPAEIKATRAMALMPSAECYSPGH